MFSSFSTLKVSESRILKAWSDQLWNSRCGLTILLCVENACCGLRYFRLWQISLKTMMLQLSRCLAYLVTVDVFSRLTFKTSNIEDRRLTVPV